MKKMCLLVGFIFVITLFAQEKRSADWENEAVRNLLLAEQYQKASEVVLPLIKASLSQQDWKNYAKRCIYAASALNSLERYDSCNAILYSCVQQHQQAGIRSHDLGTIYSYIGLNHVILEQYTDGLQAYQQAIAIFEQLQEQGDNIAYCYRNIAQIYFRRNDFPTTIAFFESAIRVDTAHTYTAASYTQLANCYQNMGLDSATLLYCQKGMGEKNVETETAADLKVILHHFEVQKGNYRRASQLLAEALQSYPFEPEYANPRLRTLTDLAHVYEQLQQPTTSLRYFKQAEQEGQHLIIGKSREMAKLYVEWGNYWQKNGNTKTALDFYQKAIVQSWPDFQSNRTTENPTIQDNAPTDLWAMTAMAKKAQTLLVQPTARTEDRKNAAFCFELSLKVANQLRKVYGKDETKLFLQQNNYNIRQEAAVNLWILSQSEKTPELAQNYLYRLMDLLESDRAATLRDALSRSNALRESGLPDSLLRVEEGLRRDLVLLGHHLSNAQYQGDSTGMSTLKKAIFETGRRHERLIQSMNTQYPAFETYGKADIFTPAQQIQSRLPDSTIVLSWLDAGDRFLCLHLASHQIGGYEILKNRVLDDSIRLFLSILSDPVVQTNTPDRYFQMASSMGQWLVPANIRANYRHLIIIPDGLLSHLPFEALLSEPYSGTYKNAPYLLRSHSIRYGWSASLLAPQKSSKPQKALFMAPFSGFSRDNLPQLTHSAEEQPPYAQLIVQKDKGATSDFFMQYAPNCGIIHLATHADIGANGLPEIEFSDRALTTNDIYECRLNAALVCLSACETGVGQLAQGEGLLSLARAFAYAGAESLVASGWKVNDRSTSMLFKVFYDRLQHGSPKSEALRLAKLQYLSSEGSDLSKSPWHWAAFTLTGADDAILMDSGGGTLWAWVVVAMVLLLGIFWRNKQWIT